MGFTQNKIKNQGFTIVELLIVVVVIAILAAITIVSYNGITNRANGSAAASNAANVLKKAELYATDDTTTDGYPTGAALVLAANSAKAYYVNGITLTTANPDSSNGKTTVGYLRCAASGTPSGQAAITNAVGARIAYWDFSASPAAIKYLYAGSVTAGNFTTALCPSAA